MNLTSLARIYGERSLQESPQQVMAVGRMLHRRCSVERVVEIALHRPARESQKVQKMLEVMQFALDTL